MTDDPGQRAEQLHDDLRRVAAAIAETAEQSARVHDDVAELHDALGERSQLDPARLREQAERDRAFAASERRVAAGTDEQDRPDPGQPDQP